MTTNQTIPFRPLGLIKSLLENIGFQISHCYEDLIFVGHNAFLLRMEQKGEDVSLFFNSESEVDKRNGMFLLLQTEGKVHNLCITRQGTYTLTPNEKDETLSLELREFDL